MTDAAESRWVWLTGASGFVGSALVPFLEAAGYAVTRLARPYTSALLDATPSPLAVIHLAGANIAGERWTLRRMAVIRDSRIDGTRALCEILAKFPTPPATLISASGVNFYGDRGPDVLREDASPGTGFLAKVCRGWESATEHARARGVRVVNLRMGLVLGARGGALARMMLPFRLGLGGRLGSGSQYMSWIAIDDLMRVFRHVMETPGIAGAVNAVAPHPVTNAVFTKALARVLRRPAICAVPAFALRVGFGRMAEETVLASIRAEPAALLASGFTFHHPSIDEALRTILGR